ncbi:MAG: hypothetical protein HY427_02845, partial [Candidatus Levybacteria bacterium]|nr:hypothetical protein [Candidatus Levybacteria bacterium]
MERLRAPYKKAGLFVGSGIAALAIACGGGNGTDSRVQNPDTPTLPPAPTEPAPIGTPTLEPAPTATEVVKAPVNCEVLPQEFCSQGERVVFTHEYLDPPVSETFIAFNLPEGVPIFSPVDGLVEPLQESGDPFSGLLLWIRYQGRYDDKIAPFIRGDIRVDSM